MKSKLLLSSILTSTLIVLFGAGCKPNASGPASTLDDSNYTAFAVSIGSVGNAYHSALIQMVGQGCSIWSDVGPWQPGEMRAHTASASCLLPGGPQLSWKCQTPDGKLFTQLEINGKEYLLANGGLFLISTRTGKPQVIQLKSPDYKVLNLEPLADQFPEVAQFLAGKPIAQP